MTKSHFLKSTFITASSTFLSRIFGFIRDMVIAKYLGTGFYADAFFVAFRIPNLLRRLFGEGSLTASYIPIFTKYYVKKGRNEANKIASISFTLLTIILIILTVLGIIFSPEIISLIAPGFKKNIIKFLTTIKLNRIMFPYIFFISLVALCMGILNSLKHFFAPAFAPVLLNISMILAAFIGAFLNKNIAFALAIGVVIGGILQLILQFYFLIKNKIYIKLNFYFKHPAIKEIALLMAPSILGLAITQFNIFINTLLASLLPTGSISYLYYADRLIQFPLGIFAVSIGTVTLPILSEQQAQNDIIKMNQTLLTSLRLTFFISIPAMIGLIILGKPIISFLFQRGAFNEFALINVYKALIGYAIGLWAYSGIRIIVPAFYSFKDTKTPVKVGFFALIINITASVILMQYLLHTGLAIATTISSFFNFLILLILLKKHINFDYKNLIKYFIKIIFPNFFLCIFLIFYTKIFPFYYTSNFFGKFVYILIILILSIFIYIASCYLFKIEEIKLITKKIKKWKKS